MIRLASKLLVLLALLLMPFGMVPASAAAQPAHSGTMSMPMQHCPEPAQQPDKGGIADCAMACAAALPAMGKAVAEPPFIICAPQQPSTVELLHGLNPETATPPPKRS
jgi:hypothetical protein